MSPALALSKGLEFSLDWFFWSAELDLNPGEYGEFGDWSAPGVPGKPFMSFCNPNVELLERLSWYGEFRSFLDSMPLVATEVRGACRFELSGTCWPVRKWESCEA